MSGSSASSRGPNLLTIRAAASAPAKPAPRLSRRAANDEELPGATLDARFTFDSFVVGKPN